MFSIDGNKTKIESLTAGELNKTVNERKIMETKIEPDCLGLYDKDDETCIECETIEKCQKQIPNGKKEVSDEILNDNGEESPLDVAGLGLEEKEPSDRIDVLVDFSRDDILKVATYYEIEFDEESEEGILLDILDHFEKGSEVILEVEESPGSEGDIEEVVEDNIEATGVDLEIQDIPDQEPKKEIEKNNGEETFEEVERDSEPVTDEFEKLFQNFKEGILVEARKNVVISEEEREKIRKEARVDILVGVFEASLTDENTEEISIYGEMKRVITVRDKLNVAIDILGKGQEEPTKVLVDSPEIPPAPIETSKSEILVEPAYFREMLLEADSKIVISERDDGKIVGRKGRLFIASLMNEDGEALLVLNGADEIEGTTPCDWSNQPSINANDPKAPEILKAHIKTRLE